MPSPHVLSPISKTKILVKIREKGYDWKKGEIVWHLTWSRFVWWLPPLFHPLILGLLHLDTVSWSRSRNLSGRWTLPCKTEIWNRCGWLDGDRTWCHRSYWYSAHARNARWGSYLRSFTFRLSLKRKIGFDKLATPCLLVLSGWPFLVLGHFWNWVTYGRYHRIIPRLQAVG